MKVLTKQDAQMLGMKTMPRHISPDEKGEVKGLGARRGAGGLLFWFEIIKLENGELRHKDRHELLGKTSEEVQSM